MKTEERMYIEDVIKPLEEEIRKLYILKYKYKFFWTRRKEENLMMLEKLLNNCLIYLEKFVL